MSSDFAYFVVEAVVTSIVSTILLVFSAKQIIYDFVHNEKWRSLIVSHYLNAASIVLLVMTNFDPAAGLGIYTTSSMSFINDTTAFIQMASGSALAASFLEGYQLMVMSTEGPPYTTICLFVMHTTFFLVGLLIFGYCAISRNAAAAVFSRIVMAIYSIAVCLQILYSAAKIRNLLAKELKKSGKYATAVRKLTRLMLVIIFLLVIGNIVNGIVMARNMEEAERTPKLAIVNEPAFNPQHLLTDITSLVTPALLLMGGWRVADYAGKSTKSTTPEGNAIKLEDADPTVKHGSRSPAPVAEYQI